MAALPGRIDKRQLDWREYVRNSEVQESKGLTLRLRLNMDPKQITIICKSRHTTILEHMGYVSSTVF